MPGTLGHPVLADLLPSHNPLKLQALRVLEALKVAPLTLKRFKENEFEVFFTKTILPKGAIETIPKVVYFELIN